MRVYNITNVVTPTLIQKGLVNVRITVGTSAIEPGGYADVIESAKNKATISNFELMGALSRKKPVQVAKTQPVKQPRPFEPTEPLVTEPVAQIEEPVQTEPTPTFSEPEGDGTEGGKKRRRRGRGY